MKCCFIFLLSIFAFCIASRASYEGYKLYQVTIRSQEDLITLIQLQGLSVDVWKVSYNVNETLHILIAPHNVPTFEELMCRHNILYKDIVPNVQKLIDDAQPQDENDSTPFGWHTFHTIAQINKWMHQIANHYSDISKLVVGGQSYKGRQIKGIKLSFKDGNKGVFFEGGIHAREWISPAVITYILNEFITSKDPLVREIVESYDWYFFPSLNPDGFQYTVTTDRLWRKTRHPYDVCTGVDANRNWGYNWNLGGSSNDSCHDNYMGPTEFSENETNSLSQYITSIASNLVGYISVHSYGSYILIPYGTTTAHAENFDELMDIGQKAAVSLAQRYGTKFLVGNMAELIYPASGTSVDWVKGTFKTPITYTYELRNEYYGFVVPPKKIIPIALETLDSIVTMWQEAKARGY